ncbi:hypothetical protein An12g03560 [Aspergillus niger]|uniref:Uncharacterized protein n=2 Tax=Aspergillus niger TaxID=5061 RepID=A2QZ42_ASPNC|nr:hypothetical protein An12g03560 [Aspergillus niger]CAK46127.1 hypothetical protein An12g03560 [Aspergillus niger]
MGPCFPAEGPLGMSWARAITRRLGRYQLETNEDRHRGQGWEWNDGRIVAAWINPYHATDMASQARMAPCCQSDLMPRAGTNRRV